MTKCLCPWCIHNFVDNSVGYFECTEQNYMTDIEYQQYEENGFIVDCPYFEEDNR